MKKSLSNPYVQAVLYMLAGGVVSALLQYEVLWDYANYHYYNGFAFLNGRLTRDIAPATILTYFNPLADAALFWLGERLDSFPAIYHFVTGLPYGALMYVVFLLTKPLSESLLCRLISVAVAGTGAAVFSQIGTASHEIFVALLVLSAVLLLMNEMFVNPRQRGLPFFWAGLLTGAAAGFKITAGMYCVTSTLCLLAFYKNMTKKQFLFFALGGGAGFFAVNGFWMLTLWQTFGNPVFPLFNGIFKSPYFPPVNYRETIYLENRTALQTLLLPFILMIHFSENFVGDFSFSDARFAFGFIALTAALSAGKLKSVDKPFMFLIVWALISYLFWLFTSSVIRYAAAVEIVCGICVVKALFAAFVRPPSPSYIADALRLSTLVFGLMILCATPFLTTSWGTRRGGDFVSEFDAPALPENTLVALYGNPASVFLAKAAQKQPSVQGIAFVQRYDNTPTNRYWDFADKTLFGERRAEILKTHKGPRVAYIEHKRFYMEHPQKFVSEMTCADILRKTADDKKPPVFPVAFVCWSKELDALFPKGEPFADYVRKRAERFGF